MRHPVFLAVSLAGALALSACEQKSADETVERAFQDVNVIDESDLNDVMLTVADPNEAVTYFQRTADVSPGGLHLAGTIPHPEGTEVRVRFSLPGGGDDIETRGTVTAGTRDAGGTGMGIRFIDLDPEAAQQIDWFIKKIEE